MGYWLCCCMEDGKNYLYEKCGKFLLTFYFREEFRHLGRDKVN